MIFEKYVYQLSHFTQKVLVYFSDGWGNARDSPKVSFDKL